MKFNFETQEYALKDFTKRQKYIKEDRYFKYNNKNYLFFNYLISILRVNLIKINLIKIDFRLFSLKEVFLNKLF